MLEGHFVDDDWLALKHYLKGSFLLDCLGSFPINMVQMAIDWSEPAVNAPYMESLKLWMSIVNILFLLVYVFEMLAKFIGLGLRQYFKDCWNVFDFLLVIVSTFDVITSFVIKIDFPFSTETYKAVWRLLSVQHFKVFHPGPN